MRLLYAAYSLLLAALVRTCAAFKLPVVDLGYEIHQAFSLNESTGLYNFSNIRYAAPPLGNFRFRAPMPPKVDRTEVQTGVKGRVCPQGVPIWEAYILPQFLKSYFTNTPFNGSMNISDYPVVPVSDPRITEDCLFLDVVVPQKVFDRVQGKTAPLPKEKLAPVIVYFFGGGYVSGDKSFTDPSGLIARSQKCGKDGIIFVALNYRLGAFGWLAGHTVSKKGTPNAAFHDQRLGLTWVAQNIHLFGGDPDRVTVMGVSAGAGSLLHQLTAYKGLQGPNLFQQAVLQSPAWEPNFVKNGQERTTRRFLRILNVTTIDQARQLPSDKLISANTYQIAKSIYGSFTYGPVVDGSFAPGLPGELLARGQFDHNVKILNGHTTNEALMYTSPANFKENGFHEMLNNFPQLSKQLGETTANTLYPPFLGGAHGYKGWVERASLALSDICFQCHSYYVNHAYENNTYSYVFSIPPGMHWMDQPYTFYIKGEKSSRVNSPIFRVANETVAYILQDYITSFAQVGVPTSPLGPPLRKYGPENRVVMFELDNITGIYDPAANPRCLYWQTAFEGAR
ncbi:Alpha/Beta hydrolase protein [Aspergillus avenaceus]|uniref:Carboxylic ester hydrolase n=1 Tax=Aspergillus avenaceus TaxID=36643 RepID=A0A5N6TEM2_ASPAV|nr:Alpha/Beta hydrolase protein [Aspergillus avenaceus]